MSKQADAKKQQGYTKEAPACWRCAHYKSEITEKKYNWSKVLTYKEETERRCGIGGFAVKKTAWCQGFVRK